MASPQTGIFALGTASHAYLEFDLRTSADAAATVAPDAALPRLTGFNEALTGVDGYTLPATQHDVVIWLTGAAYDVVFDLSRDVVAELAGVAVVAHEMVGWPYHRDLDLTGF